MTNVLHGAGIKESVIKTNQHKIVRYRKSICGLQSFLLQAMVSVVKKIVELCWHGQY